MVFGFISSLRLRLHYQYLIGQPLLPTEHPITNFGTIPVEEEAQETFWAALIRSKEPIMAYCAAKIFNNVAAQNVTLIVYSFDEGKLYWQELDQFLFNNQIERIYLQPDFKILEYEPKYNRDEY